MQKSHTHRTQPEVAIAPHCVLDPGLTDRHRRRPYTATAGSCSSSILSSTVDGQVVRSGGTWAYVTTGTAPASEAAMRSAVDRQPVVVYMDAAESFNSYGGGIYRGGDCSTSDTNLNHAVVRRLRWV